MSDETGGLSSDCRRPSPLDHLDRAEHRVPGADHASDVVVGSGPSGWAAALGVLEAGRTPTIVDFGQQPAVTGAAYGKASTLALKGDLSRLRVFDYPRSLVTSRDGNQLPLSSARGGLSTIWGAGILLRSAEDMPELGPVAGDVVSAYDVLLRHLPAAGAQDRLSTRFPWPEGTIPAPQSRRFRRLVQAAQERPGSVLLGHPRVSLRASECIRSGSCLVGCPLQLFFSADRAVEQLHAQGRCDLVSGPVLSLESGANGVVLQLPGRTLTADRVFLAAGPVATPVLLQRSGLAAPSLVVHDSAVFYAAMVNSRAPCGDEAEYTAAQAVAYSPERGSADFQVSFYESNPDYLERLAGLSPVLGRLARPASGMLGRVNAGIGFLDSSVSGRLVVTTRGARSVVARRQPPGIWFRAQQVMGRVGAVTTRLGLVPVPGAVIVPAPGSGYHTGSALPIGSDAVDHGGRLRVAPRVHVVDASALPKVWAGSHTFTAMANALRTAAES